jgi:hypothetical protein
MRSWLARVVVEAERVALLPEQVVALRFPA